MVVVLLHGYGAGSALWGGVMRGLLDRAMRVHAVDWMGMMGSARPRDFPLAVPGDIEKTSIAGDEWMVKKHMLACLDALCSEAGDEDRFVVGAHSIGALLFGSWLADGGFASAPASLKKRLAGVVFISPAGLPVQPPVYKARLPRIFGQLWEHGM